MNFGFNDLVNFIHFSFRCVGMLPAERLNSLVFTQRSGVKIQCSDLLAFYYFSAITSISKSSDVNLSFLEKAHNFAPKISTVLKLSVFNSQVISDGT